MIISRGWAVVKTFFKIKKIQNSKCKISERCALIKNKASVLRSFTSLRKEDKLRITATLSCGTHRCVPYGAIVLSNAIYICNAVPKFILYYLFYILYSFCLISAIRYILTYAIYSATRNNGTFHHLRWSPSLRAKARKEDKAVRIDAYPTFNLIYNQRVAFLNRQLTPCSLQLHFAFRTSHFALYIFNAKRSLILKFAF